jgi:hypothetical protein
MNPGTTSMAGPGPEPETMLATPEAIMMTTMTAHMTEYTLISISADDDGPTVPRTIVPPPGAGLITPSNQGSR